MTDAGKKSSAKVSPLASVLKARSGRPDSSAGPATLRPVPGLDGEEDVLDAVGGPKVAMAGSSPAAAMREPERDLSAVAGALPMTRRAGLDHAIKWSFVAVVIVPAILAAIYYFLIAAGQYVTEVKFALRSPDRPQATHDVGGNGGGLPGTSTGVADSFIVADAITTRHFVDQLEQSVGLRSMLAHPDSDFLTRLSPDAPAESVVDKWKSMVSARYDLSTGIISVKVRAFSPEDSMRLAQAVITNAERLANDMTSRARQDTLNAARDEVRAAEARLLKARSDLRSFREKEGLLDPVRFANSQVDLAARLRAELSAMKADYAAVITTVTPSSPQAMALAAKIKSVEQQVASAEGDSAAPVVAHGGAAFAHFQELESEREFAERNYQSALEAVQRAQAPANRPQAYLAVFAHPALPQAALYPNRPVAFLMVAGTALLIWGIGLLLVLGVRDHLR
jgi:capsular polysaccharide transport system permease protein